MKIFKAILCIVFLTIVFVYYFSCQSNKSNVKSVSKDTLALYLQFPGTLTSTSPYDIDIALEQKLLKEGKLAEAQRIFDILSWQLFISLNWPVDEKGNPMKEISDTGSRVWENWKEGFEIFKEDGSMPLKWGSITDLPVEFKGKIKETGHEDVLFRTSKFSLIEDKKWKKNEKRKQFVDRADEINQAFTSPIWDQNGNIVRYEIRLNKIAVDYIVSNELYNLDGQISFSKSKRIVDFPIGDRINAGTIELKFAWRIIDFEKDIPERYFTKEAYVLEKNGEFSKKTVGLVGMHIATKTKSSPQWIWATFEHVDNLEVNELELCHGKKLRASFYDPSCSTCPVNLLPDTSQQVIKNQIQRVLPISRSTQELNKQVQSLLNTKNSFWQYYELIGTQWPTDPSAPPYPFDSSKYVLPDAVTNKSGGKPVPVFLTNMIMETYFQGGTIIGSNGSPSIYNKYIANEPAFFQIEGGPQNTDTINTRKIIFGTEGCANCHHSVRIAIKDTIVSGERGVIYGKPGTGDFEWLLQLKAKFKKKA